MKRMNSGVQSDFEAKMDGFSEVSERSSEAAERGRRMFLAQASEIAAQAHQNRSIHPVEAVSLHGERRLNKWMHSIFTFYNGKERSQVMAIVVSVMAVLAMILGGSGITVAAAQTSLPGDTLYSLKLWSEDTGLKIAEKSQNQMELSLDFADRRVLEIKAVLEEGETPPEDVLNRYQEQVQFALQLSGDLDDEELQEKLLQIRARLQFQHQMMNELQLQQGQSENAVAASVMERTQAMIQTGIEVVEDGLANGVEYRQRLNQPEVDEAPVDDGVGSDKNTPANPDGNGLGPNPNTPPGGYGPGPQEPYQPEPSEPKSVEPNGPFGPDEDFVPGSGEGAQYGPSAYDEPLYLNNNYSYGTGEPTSQNCNKTSRGGSGKH